MGGWRGEGEGGRRSGHIAPAVWTCGTICLEATESIGWSGRGRGCSNCEFGEGSRQQPMGRGKGGRQ